MNSQNSNPDHVEVAAAKRTGLWHRAERVAVIEKVADRMLADVVRREKHDPFLDRLGGMIQRANARLGLDAKGNPINAGADAHLDRSTGSGPDNAGSSAPASFSYSGALVAQDFAGIAIPADAKHANPRRVEVIGTLCPCSQCGAKLPMIDSETLRFAVEAGMERRCQACMEANRHNDEHFENDEADSDDDE